MDSHRSPQAPVMRILDRADELQARALAWRAEGRPVGLVPTMGALHRGHASLMRIARREIGTEGRIIVSLFVNRPQFDARKDFERYPRTLEADAALCRREGVDLLFAPASDAEIYPPPFSLHVEEEQLSLGMEGASRPGHFRGVTTVVAILLNLAQPTLAVFGEKDYQQLVILERMIANLHFPARLVRAPTMREEDGLALSSRNALLTPEQRRCAPVLFRCLEEARRRVESVRTIPAATLRTDLAARVEAAPGARLDYLEFFHPLTLQAVETVRAGDRMALAVRFGAIRLIDNGAL